MLLPGLRPSALDWFSVEEKEDKRTSRRRKTRRTTSPWRQENEDCEDPSLTETDEEEGGEGVLSQ
jgi:hypothetical protein